MIEDYQDRNGNTNCMMGIECPKCGEHDNVRVAIRTIMEMSDDGHGDYEDVEWDDDSFMACGNSECGFQGTAADFAIPIPEPQDE
jgi:hypothetical protein